MPPFGIATEKVNQAPAAENDDEDDADNSNYAYEKLHAAFRPGTNRMPGCVVRPYCTRGAATRQNTLSEGGYVMPDNR